MTINSHHEMAEEAVKLALEEAEKFYNQLFRLKRVSFSLKGRAAGQVRFPLNKKDLPEIRLNAAILEKNPEQFLKEVIPHECAHLVVYQLYISKGRSLSVRPKPHGKEWQSVMRKVYGLEPKVTHNFEIEKSKRKSFSYICACEDKIHQLSIIRHNKVLKNRSNYLCRKCGVVLREAE